MFNEGEVSRISLLGFARFLGLLSSAGLSRAQPRSHRWGSLPCLLAWLLGHTPGPDAAHQEGQREGGKVHKAPHELHPTPHPCI